MWAARGTDPDPPNSIPLAKSNSAASAAVFRGHGRGTPERCACRLLGVDRSAFQYRGQARQRRGATGSSASPRGRAPPVRLPAAGNAAGRVPERACLRHAGRGAPDHQGLAARRQHRPTSHEPRWADPGGVRRQGRCPPDATGRGHCTMWGLHASGPLLTRPTRGRTATDLTYGWQESGEQVRGSGVCQR